MKRKTFIKFINAIKNAFCLNGLSYSQNSEDIILQNIMDNKKNGYYIDIGAHDPIRFSNTYLMYLNGWKGINIDPLPGCMEKFKHYRPDDINLNIGISSISGEIKYYSFEEPAFNTIDRDAKNFGVVLNLEEMMIIRQYMIVE
jgi:hypothetical protein